ncbi:hypothetical protein HFN60_02655 [Rhizobium leguminosarum]|uniref:hypothetical protein n=1 Tax=Rhizobium leguminosarum TaxID=384 RepID=UPI001C9697CD|nr:hypothetical protein [Rhizobium leguminosarum]MBY5814561.1 hypothetical protein [Rhizobium leguminosarum]
MIANTSTRSSQFPLNTSPACASSRAGRLSAPCTVVQNTWDQFAALKDSTLRKHQLVDRLSKGLSLDAERLAVDPSISPEPNRPFALSIPASARKAESGGRLDRQ